MKLDSVLFDLKNNEKEKAKKTKTMIGLGLSLNKKISYWLRSFSNCEPGGVHLGTLPAAGLRAEAGLGVTDMAALLGADLAAGGVLAGVVAAGRQGNYALKYKYI